MEDKMEMLKAAKRDLMWEKAFSALYAAAFAMNVAVLVFLPFSWGSLLNIVCILWMLSCFKKTTKKQIMIDHYIKNNEKPETVK